MTLIDCDFIDGKLADVVRAPVALHCALVEENPETKSKPWQAAEIPISATR